MRALSWIAALVLVFATASPAQAGEDAPSAPIPVVSLGCLVNITASVELSPEETVRTVTASILPDCSVVFSESAVLAGDMLLLSTLRTCVFKNRMFGAGGEGDVLTELNVQQDFEFDGLYVTWETSSAWTYNHGSTGWGVIDSWKRVNSTTPTPDFSVDGFASFSWWGSWHHDKYQETHAYGDGNCAAHFEHNGYVCTGCTVKFYVLTQ